MGADDELARRVTENWRKADLTPRERALCDFACKLTHLAAEVDQADIDSLRAVGLDDTAVSDAIQVIAYFNYVDAGRGRRRDRGRARVGRRKPGSPLKRASMAELPLVIR